MTRYFLSSWFWWLVFSVVVDVGLSENFSRRWTRKIFRPRARVMHVMVLTCSTFQKDSSQRFSDSLLYSPLLYSTVYHVTSNEDKIDSASWKRPIDNALEWKLTSMIEEEAECPSG